MSEFDLDTKFVRLLDEYADVVTDDLAEHLIDHGHGRSAAQQQQNTAAIIMPLMISFDPVSAFS